jgi:DNA polymerase
MGIDADIAGDWHASLAALAWQLEAGVDETISEAPVNRFGLAAEVARPMPAAAATVPQGAGSDPVAVARAASAAAGTLDELRSAMAGFELCELKKGARNLVFADGNPEARVLILGEAPGAEEDREGRPFVGRAGQLLDRMFAAIGLARTAPDPESALYITNVLPWRPPGNRDPEPGEIAMLRPFVERHISLVDPEVIVVMGNTPLDALTGARGILRARGVWTEALGRPLLPMTHPAYLLRNPAAKREAWADLLALQARLAR